MSHRSTTFAALVVTSLVTLSGLLNPSSSYGQDDRSQSAGEQIADDDASDAVVVAETADDANNEQSAAEVATPAELARRAETLEQRAGEQVGANRRGRAVILGMHVQEGDEGRVRVTEVAAASPAFDAGIRQGDEIASFDGFKGKNYREWIDGIRKLVTDTPDGETMAVEVLRNGKRFAAKILAPEAKADDPRVPPLLGPAIAEAGSETDPGVTGANPPYPPAGPAGDNLIVGGAFFGAEFEVADASERAMAEIHRLSAPPQAPVQPTARPAAPGTPQTPVPPANRQLAPRDAISPDTAAPAGTSAPADAAASADTASPASAAAPAATAAANDSNTRIGLAGFLNNETGLVVMLDVGGLAPGSYTVAIDDPSLAMSGGATTPATPAGGNINQSTNSTPPAAAAAGSPDQAAALPAAGSPSADAPSTGLPQPSRPESRTAQPALAGQAGQAARPTGEAGVSGVAAASSLSQVGTLTVDQSGTGRLQQVVEGVQVRDVVGQAIVIYAQQSQPATTVPPNTNVSGSRGTASDTAAESTGAPVAENPAGRNATQEKSAGGAQPAGVSRVLDSSESTMPIAGGVIRLMSDRRPAGAAAAPQDQGQPTEEPTGGRAASRIPPPDETTPQ